MLPDTNYMPAVGSETLVNKFVSLDIVSDFPAPVVAVGRWAAVVLWTAVPVASVDEYS